MAKLVVSTDFSLRMNNLSVADLWDGTPTIADFDLVQRENDAFDITEFRGAFLYDAETDELVGGDLTRIDHFHDDELAYRITGLDVDMGLFMDWADLDDTDMALASMFIGDDQLLGGRGADYLEGFDGHDLLDGGRGRDVLIGGTGDDTYIVDHSRDVVIEAEGEGSDRIYASRSYKLAAASAVEILSTSKPSSKSAINLTGNSLDNILLGNAGKNVLRAGSGNDDLDGGAGNDILFGGAGEDTFCFSTRLSSSRNVDRIKDFRPGADLIELDSLVFRALAAGELPDGAFTTGRSARDSSDRIVYNAANGSLSYDPDGAGGRSGIKFAQLKSGLALDALDFFVV
jgi:Ca2+-binding RTX toxin-like protein